MDVFAANDLEAADLLALAGLAIAAVADRGQACRAEHVGDRR